MAFQQPTRWPAQRVSRNGLEDGVATAPAPANIPTPNESQTWVLFTPGTDAGTTASYLSSVQGEQITPGRSRISDLGSLDTAARSISNLHAPSEVAVESVAEEDAELDSLDSHLPEFRVVASSYSQPEVPHTVPVLPGHDGLGSFRFDVPGVGADAQDRLYAFERFNPNRVRHRAESFDLAQLDIENEEVQELERTRRIEAWRLEQSQLLLEDIRKETRRRRKSEASLRKSQQTASLALEAPARSVADEEAADITLGGTDWHDQDSPASDETVPGLWTRIARKVICDLMGIDDKMLAILFGEALADDEMQQSPPKTPAAEASLPTPSSLEPGTSLESEWQLRLLNRIAKELGGLVHQISPHPGAFSTYTRIQHTPLPYAGLPVIPEATVDGSDGGQTIDDDGSVPYMPDFKPTVHQAANVLSAPSSESATAPAPTAPEMTRSDPHTFTQQEWEQDLDIRLVFRYLRSRFTSGATRPSSPTVTAPLLTTASTAHHDTAAKAARVRQHHPLVSHAYAHGFHHHHHHHRSRPASERRTFKTTTVPAGGNAAAVGVVRHHHHHHHHHHHAAGSCASQSTRRSAARCGSSAASSHGPSSSRHYWDIGGSLGGTGSVIASTGPMGSWGEV